MSTKLLMATAMLLLLAETPAKWSLSNLPPQNVANPDDTLADSASLKWYAKGSPLIGYRFVGGKVIAVTASRDEATPIFWVTHRETPESCWARCLESRACVAWDYKPVYPGKQEGYDSTYVTCTHYSELPAKVSMKMKFYDKDASAYCESFDDNAPCYAGYIKGTAATPQGGPVKDPTVRPSYIIPKKAGQ